MQKTGNTKSKLLITFLSMILLAVAVFIVWDASQKGKRDRMAAKELERVEAGLRDFENMYADP